jgi:hypothetical protein
MNDPFVFLLAVHNHQPVGNFSSVFEKAFEDCYRPFLRELHKHPAIKFAAHYSGPLLEYMGEKERECLDILKDMVASGQVELLGGGFYEPILTILPEEDRQGQLRMMNEFLEDNFQIRPRGIWLTERVWEPTLPKTLARAGIEYTLLDEEHFHYAGIQNLYAYYITEDEGYPLKIFPIDKKLRYLIPFQTLPDIESYLEEIKAQNGLAILGDDGEKFGLWPGTKKWVYEEGWLAKFLSFLEEKNIQTQTYSEVMDRRTPAGRVYLPPASYEEMMEWVLEPEDAAFFKRLKDENPAEARRYLRGGFFREFFLKYPESNHLHKRMIMISRKVNRTSNEAARKELYKGQGNDPLWHGVFGGLYLPHLREAAYDHLLKADALVPSESGWHIGDYDQDARAEAIWQGRTFGLLLKPAFGGSLVEIDHFPLSRNLMDVLSRRKEAYHVRQLSQTNGKGKSIHELAKELPAGSENFIRYDRHPRYSALDHFLHPETTLEKFQTAAYDEQGDFIDQPYDIRVHEPVLRLHREGHVWVAGEKIPVCVQKEIEPQGQEIMIRYMIRNLADKTTHLKFGSEWNFYQIAEEIAVSQNEVRLCGGRIRFEVFPRPEIWHFALQTLSQSEKGYDIIHQGFCLLPWWSVTLSGGEEFRAQFLLRDHRGT